MSDDCHDWTGGGGEWYLVTGVSSARLVDVSLDENSWRILRWACFFLRLASTGQQQRMRTIMRMMTTRAMKVPMMAHSPAVDNPPLGGAGPAKETTLETSP
jgi:hypothetical protein